MKTMMIRFLVAGLLSGLPVSAQMSSGKIAERPGVPADGGALSYEKIVRQTRLLKRQFESEPCFDGSRRENLNAALNRAREMMRRGDTARAVALLRRQVSQLKKNLQQLKNFDSRIRRIEKVLDEIMPLMLNFRENGAPIAENSLQKLNQLYENILKNRRACKLGLALKNLQYLESLIKKHKGKLFAYDKLGKKITLILRRNESNLRFLKQADLNEKEKSNLAQAEGLHQKAGRATAEKDFKNAWRLASRVRDILLSLGRAKLNPEEENELKARVQRLRNVMKRELEKIRRAQTNQQPGSEVETEPYLADIEAFVNNSRINSQKGNDAAAYRDLKNAKAALETVEKKKKRIARSGELLERLALRLERVTRLVEKSNVSEAGQLVASARTFYEKAVALRKSGKLEQSGAEARSAVKLMGKALHLIKGKPSGFREELQNQLNELKIQLDQAHSRCRDRNNPRCSDVVKRAYGHYTKARAYLKTQRLKQAIAHYEQARDILEGLQQKFLGAGGD